MRIAILGWGSLLWEKNGAFDKHHGEWKYDGPRLKIEFSRVSERTRCGALTLVVDSSHGALVNVAWCYSRRRTVEKVREDLRLREVTSAGNVHCLIINADGGQKASETMTSILGWAVDKSIDAAVWTALTSNFKQKVGEDFSPAAAMEYLKSLSPEGKAKAAEYVWRAHDFVRTPLRDALQQPPWF